MADTLFASLGGLAAVVAVWAVCIVPKVDPLPWRRSTVVDLARRLTRRGFLIPTLILATSTGANALAGGGMVSTLSACAALSQPWAGRALDANRLSYRTGTIAGLTACVGGLVLAALVAGPVGLITGAIIIGLGVGVLTPLGFAALAASSPPERLGETMGSAEVGRELGDAGGPLVVGAVAAATTLSVGFIGAATLIAVAAVIASASHKQSGR